MSHGRFLLHVAAATLAYLPIAAAQSTFPFRLQIQQGQNTATITNNSTVTVGSGVGQSTTLTFTITYTGNTLATISSAQIFGSTDFTVAPLQGAPVVLQPNAALPITIQYKPSSAQSTSAQLIVPWTETAATTGQSGASGTITLGLTGVASNLLVYYVLPTNNNVTPLSNGGTLQFPPTNLNAPITATIVIANYGSSQGVVNSVSVTGAAFQLVQLPLLPGGVNSGSTLTFGIKYTPSGLGTDTGTLTIDLGNGTFTATLNGSGAGPVYLYSVANAGQSTPVSPSSSISFPDTPVGQSSSVVLQIQNMGNAAGTIQSIATSGAPFAITGAPPFPLTIQANGTTQVTLTFTPSQPGSFTGRLLVGSDYFDLAGTALGVNLSYSYTVDGTVNSIQPSGAIVFNPAPVGLSSTIDFTVTNKGTTAAQITSIGIAGTGSSVFQLSNAPTLPATLGAGQSIKFSIVFTPTTASQAIATLLVNAQSFSLIGFGTTPPSLPSYQITGLDAQVAPYSQPAVTLALTQSYAVGLHGTLTITGDSALAGLDPAVQFSTGGQTVAFTIPAGQQQAVFANGLTHVQLQTGTIAGTITLTPTFITDGGINVTPASPQAVTAAVPNQAPTLLTAQVTARSATSLTIVVIGYSTTRSLSTLDFVFTAGPNVSLNGAHATVSLSQQAATWFSSPSSTAYGGQFSVTTQFNLQSSNSTAPVDTLQAVSVTASNNTGASSALSVPLQ